MSTVAHIDVALKVELSIAASIATTEYDACCIALRAFNSTP
jgi:hypothetical protein